MGRLYELQACGNISVAETPKVKFNQVIRPESHMGLLCQERPSQPGIRGGDVARYEELAKT
jgi:hypothetical protein